MNSSPRKIVYLLSIFTTLPIIALWGRSGIGSGSVQRTYQKYCASCHGERLEGGTGSSLRDGIYQYGKSDDAIAKVIREGLVDMGMPAYGESLSSEEIRSLVIYIQEAELLMEQEKLVGPTIEDPIQVRGKSHDFNIKKLATISNDAFWGISEFGAGDLILTQIGGEVRLFREGQLSEPIKGIPEIVRAGQGGLLDVLVHPDYPKNEWIYLAYSRPINDAKNPLRMTSVARGKIRDGNWVEHSLLFTVEEDLASLSNHHFGSRLVIADGYLYFSVGDRGKQDLAQDLSFPNGKVYRIYEDGRIPEDNPFTDNQDALPQIWSYGHRNPQGMALHPVTKELWASEHGARGGDELNIIQPGLNYGWPKVTHGMNYNGTPITEFTELEGMESPKTFWVPSIAPCGMAFYEGNEFPRWNNHLLVSGLSSKSLHLIKIEGNEVVGEEILS